MKAEEDEEDRALQARLEVERKRQSQKVTLSDSVSFLATTNRRLPFSATRLATASADSRPPTLLRPLPPL